MTTGQTLAEFARAVGISPATARQWKKRGKIVERADGYELLGTVTHHGPDVTLRDNSVTEPERDSVTVVTGAGCDVTTERDSVTERDASVTATRGVTAPYGPANPRPRGVTALGVTAEDDPRRFEPERDSVIERDNATLQRQVDALRDRVAALEAENAGTYRMGIDLSCLETRVKELEQPKQSPGSAVMVRGVGAIDPPGPQWGA